MLSLVGGLSALAVMRIFAVRIRLEKAPPNCFFVAVSSHSGLDKVLAALSCGARGFTVKPYNARKIHDVLLKFGK